MGKAAVICALSDGEGEPLPSKWRLPFAYINCFCCSTSMALTGPDSLAKVKELGDVSKF